MAPSNTGTRSAGTDESLERLVTYVAKAFRGEKS